MRTATIALVLATACGPGGGGHSGAVAWRTDIRAAMDEAARDGRRVLMYFSAEW